MTLVSLEFKLFMTAVGGTSGGATYDDAPGAPGKTSDTRETKSTTGAGLGEAEAVEEEDATGAALGEDQDVDTDADGEAGELTGAAKAIMDGLSPRIDKHVEEMDVSGSESGLPVEEGYAEGLSEKALENAKKYGAGIDALESGEFETTQDMVDAMTEMGFEDISIEDEIIVDGPDGKVSLQGFASENGIQLSSDLTPEEAKKILMEGLAERSHQETIDEPSEGDFGGEVVERVETGEAVEPDYDVDDTYTMSDEVEDAADTAAADGDTEGAAAGGETAGAAAGGETEGAAAGGETEGAAAGGEIKEDEDPVTEAKAGASGEEAGTTGAGLGEEIPVEEAPKYEGMGDALDGEMGDQYAGMVATMGKAATYAKSGEMTDEQKMEVSEEFEAQTEELEDKIHEMIENGEDPEKIVEHQGRLYDMQETFEGMMSEEPKEHLADAEMMFEDVGYDAENEQFIDKEMNESAGLDPMGGAAQAETDTGAEE